MNYILREWLGCLMLGAPWNGPPPLLYIVGSHPCSAGNSVENHCNRHWGPIRECHVEDWSGGTHGQVGRPPTGPTDLLLCPMGCTQGPLVNGLWIGLVPAEILLWWPFGPCVMTSDQSVFASWPERLWWPPFSVKSCSHRNLEGHVEFSNLLVVLV